MSNLRYLVARMELKKIPIPLWASIWCELNRWNIPRELQRLKPEGWDNQSLSEKMVFARVFMDEIENVIPPIMLSWEWNKYCMTPEQHWEFFEQGRKPIRPHMEYPYEWRGYG